MSRGTSCQVSNFIYQWKIFSQWNICHQMISHKRIDFIMRAGRAATADVDSHTDNSTKKDNHTGGKVLRGCLFICNLYPIYFCLVLSDSIRVYLVLSGSIYFVVSPFSTLTGSNIMFPYLTTSLVLSA